MKKILVFFTGLAGYIHIVLFPLLISLIISLAVYIIIPDDTGLIVCTLICLAGLITGLIMAARILNKRGPAAFVPLAGELSGEDTDENKELED